MRLCEFLFLDVDFETWSLLGQGHEGKLMALAPVLFSIAPSQFSSNNCALRVLSKISFRILKFFPDKASHSPQPQATATNSPVALGATGLGVS